MIVHRAGTLQYYSSSISSPQRKISVDQAAAAEQEITLIVQVNGKLRDRITVPADIEDESAKAIALASPAVQKLLGGKFPRQVILVPKRLVNIVL